MERVVLFACVVSVLIIYAEAFCWVKNGDGSNCLHEGSTLTPGQTYEQTTGPNCYECTCRDGGQLNCCSTGKKAGNFPDTCKVVQRGCDEVIVSKDNENENCEVPIS